MNQQPQPIDPAVLGDGAAGRAGNTINTRKAYDEYYLATVMNGGQPVPPEQWMQMQGKPVIGCAKLDVLQLMA